MIGESQNIIINNIIIIIRNNTIKNITKNTIINILIFYVRILAGDYRASDRCGAIIELLLLQINQMLTKYKPSADEI